ncbi:MAG: dephospho-CoA kinase [Clostridiales bacterium]|nr:dephospho-CoA kinase [Clostridiales bacterium]
MIVLGITGGSGTGKSTAAEVLKKEGAYIIDCDKLAREVVEKGTDGYKEVVDFFGSKILAENGDLNRKALGDIVFNDRAKLKRLEEITHSAIKAEVLKRLEAAKNKGTKLVVIDAPLLIEAGLNSLTDKIWLFTADFDVRLERISKRDGISLKSAESRFLSQTPAEKLIKFADEVIDTSCYNIEETEVKIKRLKEHLYA